MTLEDDMERYARERVAINAAGFMAGRRGEPREANPYNPDYWDGYAWLDGWNDGQHLTVVDPVYEVVDWG